MKKVVVFSLLFSIGLTFCLESPINAIPVNQQSQIRQSEITVKGKVVDEFGEPVLGASVIVKGSQVGVAADLNGQFTISAPAGAILEVSSIGYVTTEVRADGRIQVVLKTDSTMLEEVVAVGYGTQKKVNLTGSVSSVSSKNLENRPVNNVLQALQGQMPGVQIKTNNGGQPGMEQMSIQIRGRNSFSTGSDPLVVIDGVNGSLNDIDVNSIASISVLKDAASASIYGARGSNGVIVITTKKGISEGQLNVTYSGKALLQTPYMWRERIWDSPEYMRMYNAAMTNAKGFWPIYPDEVIQAYEQNGPSEEYPSFNYEKEYIKKAFTHTHNVAVSGSNGKTNYYVSGNAWLQDGLIRHHDYNRYNFLANLESQVNDWIKIGVSSNFSISKRTAPFNESGFLSQFGQGTFIASLLTMRPTFAPTMIGPNGDELFVFKRYPYEYSMFNPEALLNLGGLTDKSKKFRFNGFVEFQLAKGLKWTTRASYEFFNGNISRLAPKIDYYVMEPLQGVPMWGANLNRLNQEDHQGETKTVLTMLTYDKTFGDGHNFSAMAAASAEDHLSTYMMASREDLPNLETDQLDAAGVNNWSNGGNITSNNALVSFFGRINYNYKYRYLLELNFRYDGSSRFPVGNRYAFFPSVSAAWRISEESFIKDNASWINNLKLRASYGLMGNNAIGDFPYQPTLASGVNYVNGTTLMPGYAKTALANDKIKWENTANYGVGLDATLWNGMFDMVLDVYSKKTSGILRNTQLPGYVGLGAPKVNEGIVSNKGFELTLSHNNTVGDFNYGISLNIAKNWNKLVSFGAPQLGTTMMKEGYEMNRYFTYQADGIFQNQQEIDEAPEQLVAKNTLIPGDIRLKDVNGDGKVTADDRVDMDGINPDFTYGGNLHFGWKGLDVSAVFQGVHGTKVNVNNTHIVPFGNGNAPLKYWRDAWTPENTDTDIPIMKLTWWSVSPWDQTYYQMHSWWLKSTSYFRLKNVSVSYSLPEKIFRNSPIQGLRLYSSIENVFTITPFEFGDPERPNELTFPSLRTFSFGIDLKF